MRKIFALFAALCLIAFVVPLAIAQDTAAVPRSSWLFEIWGILQPMIVVVVSIVGPALGTWISIRLVSLLKIQDENSRKAIEARVRDALHASALNGLKYAMTRAGLPQGVMPSPVVIAEAIDYVRTKNPETLRKSGIDDLDLEEIILSKVPDVLAKIAGTRG